MKIKLVAAVAIATLAIGGMGQSAYAAGKGNSGSAGGNGGNSNGNGSSGSTGGSDQGATSGGSTTGSGSSGGSTTGTGSGGTTSGSTSSSSGTGGSSGSGGSSGGSSSSNGSSSGGGSGGSTGGVVVLNAPAGGLVPNGVACAVGDISPAAEVCAGFYTGNLLNNAHIDEQKQALALLGFTWDGATVIQDLAGQGGSQVYDFTQLLKGVTYIGLHFGNGGGSPNGTAFYRLDAGNGLDTFSTHFTATSNARLYYTEPTNAVPEPAAWVMMILGFGGMGAIFRRRRALAAA